MNGATYTADDKFLKFEYADTDFLVPLDDIVHIAEQPPEESCVVGTDKPNTQNCYIEVQGENQTIFLTAHHIYGVVSVENDRQKYLPDSVKTPENEWIFAVAFDMEKRKAMFLIDSHQIRQSEAAV